MTDISWPLRITIALTILIFLGIMSMPRAETFGAIWGILLMVFAYASKELYNKQKEKTK
jgi:uncharacterized RDD family membrane protein YckC